MRQKPAKVVPMTRRGNAASTTVPPSANVAERRTWVAKHLTMGHRPTAVAQMGAAQFGAAIRRGASGLFLDGIELRDPADDIFGNR